MQLYLKRFSLCSTKHLGLILQRTEQIRVLHHVYLLPLLLLVLLFVCYVLLLQAPLVYFFGHTSPDKQEELYRVSPL
jgi:hypothetical protein